MTTSDVLLLVKSEGEKLAGTKQGKASCFVSLRSHEVGSGHSHNPFEPFRTTLPLRFTHALPASSPHRLTNRD